MSKERERVLEMIADGTITAAEGLKLLEALGSTGSGPDVSRTPRRKRIINTKSMINEIGPMIQATMGDVFKGRKSFETYENMDLEEVESVSEDMEDKQELVIQGNMEKGKSISLSLSRSEDSILRATLDNDSTIKVGSKNNRRVLLWRCGELSVQVPDCLDSVKVFSRGGGISSSGVNVPVELKTMGGGIDISRPGNKFSIKTMGGGLDIVLDENWKSSSKAKTMGGGISIKIINDVPVLINATTLGGSVGVVGGNHEIVSESGKGHGKSKITVLYGTQEDPPQLNVTSMGGGIEIEGEADE